MGFKVNEINMLRMQYYGYIFFSTFSIFCLFERAYVCWCVLQTRCGSWRWSWGDAELRGGGAWLRRDTGAAAAGGVDGDGGRRERASALGRLHGAHATDPHHPAAPEAADSTAPPTGGTGQCSLSEHLELTLQIGLLDGCYSRLSSQYQNTLSTKIFFCSCLPITHQCGK